MLRQLGGAVLSCRYSGRCKGVLISLTKVIFLAGISPQLVEGAARYLEDTCLKM